MAAPRFRSMTRDSILGPYDQAFLDQHPGSVAHWLPMARFTSWAVTPVAVASTSTRSLPTIQRATPGPHEPQCQHLARPRPLLWHRTEGSTPLVGTTGESFRRQPTRWSKSTIP